jgi:glycosyltransferase involved in cell wall biosynthesis
VLVDPTDPASIAAGLERALAEPDRWALAGRERTAGLTWERTAAATVEAYREVAG